MNTQYDLLDMQLGLVRDKWTARLWGWFLDDAGNGPGVANALDQAGRQNTRQFLADLMYQDPDFKPDWDISARLSYLHRYGNAYFEIFPPGTVMPVKANGDFGVPFVGFVTFTQGVIGNPVVINDQFGLELATIFSGLVDHQVRLATGYKYLKEVYEHYTNYGRGVLDGTVSPIGGALTNLTGTLFSFMPDSDRHLGYISLQDEWAFARNWELTGGVRYDKYSDSGSTINPRAALVWETRPDLTTKLLYGEAFRPPSFSELYARNNPATIGNVDLDPEEIKTYELVFDYQPVNKMRTVVSLFRYEIENLIDLVNSNYTNVRDQEGQGFELEVDWIATDTLRFQGSYAYQRSRDSSSKQLVAFAPGKQVHAGVHWQFLPDWSINGQYFWIGDRRREAGDPRQDIEDYQTVNLTLRRKNIAGHWDVGLAARNLFDEDIREPSRYLTTGYIPNDYPMEGRSVWLEAKTHF